MSAIITLEGKAQWAFVNKPREAFGKFGWSVDLQVDAKSKKVALDAGLVLAKRKTTDNEGNETTATIDPATIRTFKHVKRKDGATNKPPIVVDSHNVPTSVIIGNGSKVRVQIKTFPWTFKQGTGAELMALQVLELEEFVENRPDFEVAEGGFKADVIKDIADEEDTEIPL